MTGASPGRTTVGFDRRLLIGPGLVILGLGLLKLSDLLLFIGPFDRAQFGWSVPIPMILLAPGALGVVARWSGRPAARQVALVTGLLLGFVVGVAWFTSTTQVGCDPHPDLATRLLASLPIPLVLGIGWTLAGRLAIRFADRPLLALVAGVAGAIAAGLAMLVAWAAFFPGLTCAPGAVPVG
jgi:hypothetical protein